MGVVSWSVWLMFQKRFMQSMAGLERNQRKRHERDFSPVFAGGSGCCSDRCGQGNWPCLCDHAGQGGRRCGAVCANRGGSAGRQGRDRSVGAPRHHRAWRCEPGRGPAGPDRSHRGRAGQDQCAHQQCGRRRPQRPTQGHGQGRGRHAGLQCGACLYADPEGGRRHGRRRRRHGGQYLVHGGALLAKVLQRLCGFQGRAQPAHALPGAGLWPEGAYQRHRARHHHDRCAGTVSHARA